MLLILPVMCSVFEIQPTLYILYMYYAHSYAQTFCRRFRDLDNNKFFGL